MKIKHIESLEEFNLLKRAHSLLVLDFYSEDCAPCEKLAPIYKKIAEMFPSILFAKIFRQNNRELSKSLGVSGSPTVLFFKKGELLEDRLSGEIEEEKFINIIKSIGGESITTENTEIEIIPKYDLCIIGNGPAGLSAALYAARYKLNLLLIGDLPGGLMTSSHKICNFPSETEISGMDLTKKMTDQILSLNVPQKKFTRVNVIKTISSSYKLELSNGEVIESKTILLATGTNHRHLGLPNEESFIGRGVSYCATCDADFYTDKIVAVVGGSDSANTTSLYLAQVAKKVYQIYRGENLRGDVTWIDQVKNNNKIEIIYNTNIVEIIGEKQLTGLKLDRKFNGQTEIILDGIFVEIGSKPDPILIEQLSLDTDKEGYIVTKQDQTTSIPGIWAAGDITTNSDSFRQIITACSEGAIAASNIFKYIQSRREYKI